MLAIIRSAALLGVLGRPVTVEVQVTSGLPSCVIVGLPDAACREARDRVRVAILSAGCTWPMQRVTVNLAPSSLPKIGTALDLAVAVGILSATGQVPEEAAAAAAYLGELGLDGSIRPVRGVVPLVAGLRRGPIDTVVVSGDDATDADLVPDVAVRCAFDLGELVAALRGDASWPQSPPAPAVAAGRTPDLAEVRGQPVARRVVEIAAAGGHHVLLSGPPGAGKTLLATRLPGLLPDLDDAAALEVTAIWSAAGEPVPGALIRRPPLRAPHHSASMVSIIGGGTSSMRPGEISLAHQGVLFLDEFGEFPPAALDALRQPLEEGAVRVTRARGSVTYPASFQLVAATNPCPCGEGGLACRCSSVSRQRYLRRLSGPLLDRFDLRLDVQRPSAAALLSTEAGESSAAVAARVAEARAQMAERGVSTNAAIPGWRLDALVPLDAEAARFLAAAVQAGRLSGRGVHRVRRVARTIADLDGHQAPVTIDHIAEAAAMRADLVAGRSVA